MNGTCRVKFEVATVIKSFFYLILLYNIANFIGPYKCLILQYVVIIDMCALCINHSVRLRVCLLV